MRYVQERLSCVQGEEEVDRRKDTYFQLRKATPYLSGYQLVNTPPSPITAQTMYTRLSHDNHMTPHSNYTCLVTAIHPHTGAASTQIFNHRAPPVCQQRLQGNHNCRVSHWAQRLDARSNCILPVIAMAGAQGG